MGNSPPLGSQSDARRIDGALKSKISASHKNETIHQCSPPSVSESMKRKASDFLSSSTRKPTRNLSWNAFQDTDMHELSSDDGDNRKMQRTEVAPSRYSNHGHSPSQPRPSSHFCRSLENRAGNRQIKPAVPRASPKSHAGPNIQVNSNSQNQQSRELSVTNSKAKNSEVRISTRNQQETSVRKLDPQSHFDRDRSLVGNGCVSSLGKEFQPAKVQAQQQMGSMFSPIIIDDEEEVSGHHNSHQTMTGIRRSGKQRLCDSSIVQAPFPNPRMKGDLKNFRNDVADMKYQDAPAAFQQRFGNGKSTPALATSETLTRGNINRLNEDSDFSDHQRTSVTSGEPKRQIRLPNLKPRKITPTGQAKEQSSYYMVRSSLPNRADHEEDLDKVMRTKITNETIAAAPNLPSHVQLTRVQSMFAAQAERQGPKYGIKTAESDQATKASVPWRIDHIDKKNQTSHPCSYEKTQIQDAESDLSSKVSASPALTGASGRIDIKGQIQDQTNTLDNLGTKADILTCAQHPQNLTGLNCGPPSYCDTIAVHNLPFEGSTPAMIKHQARSTHLENQTQSFYEIKPGSVQAGIETSKSVNRHEEAQLNMSLFVQDTEEPEHGSRVNITNTPSIIDSGQSNMETEVQRGMKTIKAMKQKVMALKKVKDDEHANPTKAKEHQIVVLGDNTRDNVNRKKTLAGNDSADTLASMGRESEELQGKGSQMPVEARNCRHRVISGHTVNNPTSKYVTETDSDGRPNNMGWIGLTEATTLLNKDISRSRSKGTGHLSGSYSRNKVGHGKASQESGVSDPSSQFTNSRNVSHKTKKDYSGIPLDLDKITNDDWFLMQLYKKGWGLKEIHSRWDELTGSTKTRESLRKRLGRLRTTFPDLFTNLETQPMSAEKIRKRNENILRQLRDGQDNIVLFNTGEDGENTSEPLETEVARAEKRKLALTVGLPETISQGHVETGGKKISEDLQRYILDALAREREDNSEYSYDEESTSVRTGSPVVDDDKVHFVYQVRRRTIKHHQPDDYCEWQYCADTYFTVEDANNAAIEEVKSNRGFDVWPITKWTAEISEETGLIRHYGSGENGTVEVEVERHLRTYHEGIVPESKIGWLKRQVFDVYEERTTCEETIDWEYENIEEIEQDSGPLPMKMLNRLNQGTPPINQPLDDSSEIESHITTKSCNRKLPNSGSTSTDEPQDVAMELEQHSTPRLETTSKTVDEDDYLFVEDARASPDWPHGDPKTSLETSSKAPIRTVKKTKVLRKVTHVLQRPIGSVCTVRDSANRLAGKTFRSLQKELDTNPDRRRRTYENCEAEKLADEEMAERLDKMEMDDESFDDIIVTEMHRKGDGGSASSNTRVRARVRVVERTLENPRNL